MRPLALLFAFCSALLPLRAASPLLTLENILLPSPAPVGTHSPRLLTSSDSTVHLLWVAAAEAAATPSSPPAAGHAVFDPASKTWTTSPAPPPTPPAVTPAAPGPFVIFPDGSALAAHRARNPDGSAEFRIDRLSSGRWQTAHILDTDPSPTTNTAAHAPALAARDGRVVVAWHSTSSGSPRLYLASSLNAGGMFLMPASVEERAPLGPVAATLLRDGTAYVVWLETSTATENILWLRRMTPGGELSVPVILATLPAAPTQPRLALLDDTPGRTIRLLLAYATTDDDTTHLVTRLLDIAPTLSTPSPKNCNCPTADESARGYPLRGRILSLDRDTSAATLAHDGIPGLIPSGTTAFRLDPELLNLVTANSTVHARAELRGRDWWIFEVRLLAAPDSNTTPRP